MHLSEALEGYIIASLAEGYSQLTLNVYQSALGIMIEHLGDPELESITTEDLRGFMKYLVTDYAPKRINNPDNKEKLSTASHHRYWKAMRSFFKWADRDLKCGRPDLPLKMPAWENKEIVPFSEEEIRLLMKGCEYANVPAGKRQQYRFRKPNALRNKAILLTLLDTGVRVGELIRLQIKDVNLENGELYVRPFHVKKTHSRTTYLGKSARKVLWRYLVDRHPINPSDPLFVNRDDQPVTRQSVLHMLNDLGKNVGIKNVHPHRFRHTFGRSFGRLVTAS